MLLIEEEADGSEYKQNDNCKGREIRERNNGRFHDVFSFYFIFLLDIKWFFQIGNTIFQIYQLFFEVFGFQIAILTIQDFFFHVVGAIAQSCEVIKKNCCSLFFSP